MTCRNRRSSPWNPVAIALAFVASTAHASYVVVDEVENMPPPAAQSRGQSYVGSSAILAGLSPARTNPTREDEYAIPFPKGVTPITAVSREVLDRVFARISPDAKIRIVGRPDAMFVTTGEANEVPRKRAINLRGYFARRGIPMNNITLQTDNDPNPTLDGNLYPSYIYVTQSNTENQITPQRYTQQRETPVYQNETIIESPRRSSGPTVPVQATNTPVTLAAQAISGSSIFTREQLFAYINTGVQGGQLSPAVALQLIRAAMMTEGEPTPRMLPTPTPAPAPAMWLLDKQFTLRENVDNWSRLAGWNPTQWDATNYYQVGTTTTVKGDFPEVLRKVAESTGLNICAKPRQKVVRITNSDTPCN